MRSGASGVARLDPPCAFRHCRDALPREPRQTSDDRVGCSALRWSMRSGASRRCMSRRAFQHFCRARSRVPIVFGPFHYCAFCERAAPDAPETIHDQRRCTGCRDRTIYGGSRGPGLAPDGRARRLRRQIAHALIASLLDEPRRIARERVPTAPFKLSTHCAMGVPPVIGHASLTNAKCKAQNYLLIGALRSECAA